MSPSSFSSSTSSAEDDNEEELEASERQKTPPHNYRLQEIALAGEESSNRLVDLRRHSNPYPSIVQPQRLSNAASFGLTQMVDDDNDDSNPFIDAEQKRLTEHMMKMRTKLEQYVNKELLRRRRLRTYFEILMT